jgi:hypothetical protein
VHATGALDAFQQYPPTVTMPFDTKRELAQAPFGTVPPGRSVRVVPVQEQATYVVPFQYWPEVYTVGLTVSVAIEEAAPPLLTVNQYDPATTVSAVTVTVAALPATAEALAVIPAGAEPTVFPSASAYHAMLPAAPWARKDARPWMRGPRGLD